MSIGQHAPELTDPDEIELWNRILENQGNSLLHQGEEGVLEFHSTTPSLPTPMAPLVQKCLCLPQ